MEEFKNIIEFENYEISNLGNVRNKTTQKILKPRVRNGYKELQISKNSKSFHKTIHRLIAEAFIENIENKPFVEHIDNDKLNNDVNNLRWCSKRTSKKPNLLIVNDQPNNLL